MFKRIELSHWRQFSSVQLEFDERMTVLTGENGSGKTTILNILSRHFGWDIQLISTPLPVSKTRAKQIWSDVWDMYEADLTVPPGSHKVGELSYWDGRSCNLMSPPQIEQAQYHLNYENQQAVAGLHVPSHRPPFAYQRVQDIPVEPRTVQQQYQNYQSILLQLFQSDRSQNPGRALKQSLISLAVFGYGNQVVAENPEYKRIFEEFQQILGKLLPKSLGFRRLEIRIPDIVFITDSGDFSLDAASGGIGALVGIAWQIYMYGEDKQDFVVTIDEPESHLHPSMQRELLPNLFQAFPRAQFIIASHSPFVVTSSPEARVYALTFNENRRVDSILLENVDLSGTANETLREVLGVPLSVPIWVENRLKEIIEKYRFRELNTETLQLVKKELQDNQLGLFLPETLSELGEDNA